MGITTVSWEYTPGSCGNSRNPIRHIPWWEMRPESPALDAEQFRFPNQTHKEPQCAWSSTRESTRSLSQDERNTAVISGMQKSLVYPKSTRDEAHFLFIESIAIPFSTYTEQVASLPLENYRYYLRNQSQVYMNINFRTATRGKFHAPHIIPGWEQIRSLWWKRWANFPQAPQEEFSLSSSDLRGTLWFLSQVEWTLRGPDSKKGLISLYLLKFSLVFHLTDEGMSECPVETLEKAVGVCLNWTGGITSFWPLERHKEFNAS